MRFRFALSALVLFASFAPAQGTKVDYDRSAKLAERFRHLVFFDRVDPIWNKDGTFSYERIHPDESRSYVLVDPATGTKKEIERPNRPTRPKPPKPVPNEADSGAAVSPDGKWIASIQGHNLHLRNADQPESASIALSVDGTEQDAYGALFWSPDSKRIVAIRTKIGGDRKVTLVETSPKDRLQPKTRTLDYTKPGDAIPHPKPVLFDVAKRAMIPVKDDLFPNPWDLSYEHWSRDGTRFFFVYNQRGHGVVRLLAIDAATGAVSTIANEETETFFDYAAKLFVRYVDETDEVLWMSERSGWNHLYLCDLAGKKPPQSITSGAWLVQKVIRADDAKRELVLQVLGIQPKMTQLHMLFNIHAEQDPYHVHFAKVNYDGTGFVLLTDDDGTHSPPKFSPKGDAFITSFSRVDAAPVTQLRRTADGKLILELERADTSHLERAGWKPPERFAAKGRDGKTDIYGIIHRPTNFDPKKTYPVIENIYAGPHGHHVPKAFRPFHSSMLLAELGFVVVQIDGMGTNWRSKAFHDVCWKNLGDAGFPDRIAWIRAAVKAHPEFDLKSGVGIYGGSAGGQSSTRALLAHGDFYTVAVSDCGCHDNRMDKIWWNELWMGWPLGSHYAEQANSNPEMAKKLKGKLMLVVGELDDNVDPASTYQVADALIRADRDFDLLVIPGAGHGACESPYGQRRRADFFVRHLLKAEPRR